MKGKYKISAFYKTVRWELILRRKITVLTGDSATGKSSLYQALRADYYKSDVPLNWIEDGLQAERNAHRIIKGSVNEIIVLDEPDSFISSKEFIRLVNDTDCYFLIISRNIVKGLTYSVSDYVELFYDGDCNRLRPIYNVVERINMHSNVVNEVLTEDSGSGNTFMNRICKATSSNGKDNVRNCLIERSTLYCVDGAAFGENVHDVVTALKECGYPGVLCMTESFEYNLLSWTSVGKLIHDDSMNAQDNCDFSQYLTWEQYFIDVLKRVVPDYNKHSLCRYIRSDTVVQQYKEHLEKLTGLTFNCSDNLTSTQIDALQREYPIAYAVYKMGGDLADVQAMIDDVKSRYN